MVKWKKIKSKVNVWYQSVNLISVLFALFAQAVKPWPYSAIIKKMKLNLF